MTKILLVESDPLQSLLLSWSLRQSGFEVQGIHNAAVFWEYLEFFSPDLILTELVLPDVDGFDLLEELARRKPHPPVIVLTTCSFTPDRERALGFGVSRYITKPENPEVIALTIGEVLAE